MGQRCSSCSSSAAAGPPHQPPDQETTKLVDDAVVAQTKPQLAPAEKEGTVIGVEAQQKGKDGKLAGGGVTAQQKSTAEESDTVAAEEPHIAVASRSDDAADGIHSSGPASIQRSPLETAFGSLRFGPKHQVEPMAKQLQQAMAEDGADMRIIDMTAGAPYSPPSLVR